MGVNEWWDMIQDGDVMVMDIDICHKNDNDWYLPLWSQCLQVLSLYTIICNQIIIKMLICLHISLFYLIRSKITTVSWFVHWISSHTWLSASSKSIPSYLMNTIYIFPFSERIQRISTYWSFHPLFSNLPADIINKNTLSH